MSIVAKKKPVYNKIYSQSKQRNLELRLS